MMSDFRLPTEFLVNPFLVNSYSTMHRPADDTPIGAVRVTCLKPDP